MATRQVAAGTIARIEGNTDIERSSTNTGSRIFSMDKTNQATTPSRPLARTNFLKIFLEPAHVRTEKENARILCYTVNALTGACVQATMRALNDDKYGRTSPDDVPTLDERNEQDEHARGSSVDDYNTHATGHAYPVKPMTVARILNGVRHHLYDDMHALGDYATEHDALVFTPPAASDAVRNYTQPMSAELYLTYIISRADVVNESEVQATVQLTDTPAEMVRQAMKDDGIRRRANLLEMLPAVLTELNGMGESFDIDAFTGIGIEPQCRIAIKIAEKLDKDYMRLLPRALRSLEALSELNIIKAEHALISAWLRDNDDDLQEAIRVRDALRAGESTSSLDASTKDAVIAAVAAARAARDAAPAATL